MTGPDTARWTHVALPSSDLDATIAGGPGVTVGAGGAYPSGTIRLTGRAAADMKRALGVCPDGACYYEAGHAGKCSDQ